MSEGSFFLKKNNDACFQLKQRVHVNLFEAFKIILDTKRKITIDLITLSNIEKYFDYLSSVGANYIGK